MEFKQQQAIYLQIADFVCEQILQKQLPDKERIPSVRELAVELEVNPNTIVRAYGYLESSNIIVKQRGIGYFVAEGGLKTVVQLKKEEFFQQDLPKLANKMQLLGVDHADCFKQIQNLIRGENNENQ